MAQESLWGVPIPKPDHEGEYTAEFEVFWKIHPEGGKRAAFKAFLIAIPAKVTIAAATATLIDYRSRKVRPGFDGCNLSTWLNQGYFDHSTPGSGYTPPTFHKNAWDESAGLTAIKNPLRRIMGNEATDEAGA